MSTHSPLAVPSFNEYLTLERTLFMVSASSKKRVIELLANTFSTTIPQMIESVLFDSFVKRERLGSTGLGKGFALPHCRAKEIEQVVGCFLRLKDPVDFDAIDKQPVDLLFALVVPEEATDLHLTILSKIAEKFSNQEYIKAVRQAESQEKLFEILTSASS